MNINQNKLYNAVRYHSSIGSVVDFVTFTNTVENRRSFVDCFNDLIDDLIESNGDFKYFSVFTLEGNGVVHCIFVDCFFDINELKNKWIKLTGAYEVRKSRFIEDKGINLSCYLNNQKDFLKTDFTEDFFS